MLNKQNLDTQVRHAAISDKQVKKQLEMTGRDGQDLDLKIVGPKHVGPK